jgi:hypothetical protein
VSIFSNSIFEVSSKVIPRMEMQKHNGSGRIARKSAKRSRDDVLNVSDAAGLLMISPAWVRRLEKEGWFRRDGAGFDLVELVQGFVRYLRDEARRATKSAAVNRVQAARAAEIELRTAERAGLLMETAEAMSAIDTLCGLFIVGLGSFSARCSRDMAARREIDAAVIALREEIAAKCAALAQAMEAKAKESTA